MTFYQASEYSSGGESLADLEALNRLLGMSRLTRRFRILKALNDKAVGCTLFIFQTILF
jgi:hypothetical protein